mmetsp:Transcript_33744/g.84429  ORF Transcript_33744/g.84429 Transcript_33744/m.84429 type:complete len:95 (-) Transcript_33744:1107-1391(-)
MRDCAPSPPVAASCALLRVRPSFAPQTNSFPLFDPTIVNSPWLCSIVKTLVRRVVTQVQVDACCYSTCSFMSRLLPDGNRIDCDKSLVVRPTSC